ncbi:MAG: monovalent cation/H+ antiporter complex subunit F [Rhodospirillales bacterium]|nr:monovalent cation/H+ antiporter complex subunit F [Rhodospirillales bacterium]
MTLFAATAIAVLVAMALALVRAFTGPTVFDRILAVNTTGTLTVVLIAVYGFIDNRPDFLDIALLYALINFIGTVAVTKFVRFGGMGVAPDKRDQGDI